MKDNTMRELILAVDARCKHGRLTEYGSGCYECDWHAQLMDTKYPARVKYIGSGKELTKDMIYTAKGFVFAGVVEGSPVPGLLLLSENGGYVARTFNPMEFVLVK